MTRRSGSIVNRGPNKWLVRVYLGRGADGKPKYLNRTVHGTKGDAQRLLNGLLRDRDLGAYAAPEKLTLDAYLDRWLAAVEGTVKESTLRNYRDLLRLYVRPTLGMVRLTDLKPLHVQEVYRAMAEKGLSARTVRLCHAVLHAALEKAVKWQLIVRNPCDAVDPPRQQRREMVALTEEEARRFLDAARGTKHEALFAFLLATGMRPGEALAIRWSDLDLKKGTATVRRALVRGKDGGYTFADPKTALSRRTVSLPEPLVRMLREHKARQNEERLARGAEWEDLGLVFCNEVGRPLDERNLYQRHFRPLADKAGLPPGATLYSLRHTCATLLLKAGVHPKVVAERLGHSTTNLTLNVYSHVLPGMQEEATAKIGAMIFGEEEAARPDHRRPRPAPPR
jgi:integrase